MGKKNRFLMTAILFLAFSSQVFAEGILASFKSQHGGYLQGYTSGEMHASNENRSQEETWRLHHLGENKFALQNYRTNKFLAKEDGICLTANRPAIGAWEHFRIISGKPYGFPNKVAIQSVKDGTFLGANPAGQDTHCGGEVAAGDTTPHFGQGNWPGYWEMATTGEPGSVFCGGPFGFLCSIPWSDIKIVIEECMTTGVCQAILESLQAE